MTLQELNPTLTPPKRLAALGMLASSKKVDFGFMADHLELSDSDLSKQMKVLSAAGYVKSTKTGRGSARRTWFTMTAPGRSALSAHLAALNALVLAELPPPRASSESNSPGP